MSTKLTHRIDDYIVAQRLPPAFKTIIDDHYMPLANWLYRQLITAQPAQINPLVIGINGAQGTGKSTLSTLLKIILEELYELQIAVLSLDDIYLTKAERCTLARTVHPLLQTRGVPGTHDADLGIELIEQLKALKAGETIYLPRFDKGLDERQPKTKWAEFTGPADLILFEGWCLGSSPFDPNELGAPINELETEQDPNAVWRTYINIKLQTSYRDLFSQVDLLIMLRAPDLNCVRRWRFEQEQKLTASNISTNEIMDERTLLRFIQYYERLTLHNLTELPDRADVVLTLDDQHNVTDAYYK